MMAIYTKTQQYAIISVLIMIMEADGVINPHEVEFMNVMFAKFNIAESELDTINSYNIEQCRSIISNMDKREKDYAESLFTEMAKCDGYVDPRELKIISLLGQ